MVANGVQCTREWTFDTMGPRMPCVQDVIADCSTCLCKHLAPLICLYTP